MADLIKDKFIGFSPKTLTFLKQLKKNNDKLWFETHKQEFDQQVMQPLQTLVSDLGAFMLRIDPLLEVRPSTNKTISRIYRDTRFSKDKSPYKTTMWLTFKRPGENWQDGPAFFFEIAPDSYRYGMGFYQASKDTMDKMREIMGTKPREFQKAISFYAKQKDFIVEGEQYKRILNPDLSEALQLWYQRKSLYLVCNRKIDNVVMSKALVQQLQAGFKLLTPLYLFLWYVVSLTRKKEQRKMMW